MAVTLIWVRDHYDTDKSRRIEEGEKLNAYVDWRSSIITEEQYDAVYAAYNEHILLPAYTTATITCSGTTPHHSSGCALLKHYDENNDGVISNSDRDWARRDRDDTRRGTADLLTTEECDFVIAAESAGSINAMCSGCFAASPPGTETRTTSLAEGTHNIVITLAGYEEFKARINVGSSSVTCVRISGNAACGGSSLPRLNVTGTWEVTAHMKTGTGGTARCTWVGTQNTDSVNFISDMVLAYNNLKNIGFVPSASEIGDGVLMYSKLGTPASLWGC